MLALGDRCRVAAEARGSAGRRRRQDLYLAHPHPAESKRFQRGLLGGKASCEVAARPRARQRVLELSRREQAFGKTRAALERALDSFDLDQVDADPGDRGHGERYCGVRVIVTRVTTRPSVWRLPAISEPSSSAYGRIAS